jgi:hypothetical protein
MTTTATTTRKRRTAAADTAAPAGDELDVTGEQALEGVVIAPELQFVTPKRERSQVDDELVPFSIDAEQYTIIAPAKLEETLAPLIASGARAADESDVLWAGANFLRKVLAPESLGADQRAP